MGNSTIKSIRTIYKGQLYRSRLEARYARFLDLCGIRYQYEPEGMNLGGVYYLPDFYLPDADMFLEVKGVMDPESEDKILTLARKSGKTVLVGAPSEFYAVCSMAHLENYATEEYADDEVSMANFGLPRHAVTEIRPQPNGANYLVRCAKCGKWYIIGYAGWDCRHCGYYDGDHSFDRYIGFEEIPEFVSSLDVSPSKREITPACRNCASAEMELLNGFTRFGCIYRKKGERGICRMFRGAR